MFYSGHTKTRSYKHLIISHVPVEPLHSFHHTISEAHHINVIPRNLFAVSDINPLDKHDASLSLDKSLKTQSALKHPVLMSSLTLRSLPQPTFCLPNTRLPEKPPSQHHEISGSPCVSLLWNLLESQNILLILNSVGYIYSHNLFLLGTLETWEKAHAFPIPTHLTSASNISESTFHGRGSQ